jgi:hypothetical protein
VGRHFSFNVSLSIPIDVEVEVTGSSSPAVHGGPPDAWAPAEYEDERSIVGASIGGRELDADTLKRLLPYLVEAVHAADVGEPSDE